MTSSSDLISALVVVGVLILGVFLGVVLARRARRKRRAEIEAAGEPPALAQSARQPPASTRTQGESAPAATPKKTAALATKPLPRPGDDSASKRPLEARPPAQILPFPSRPPIHEPGPTPLPPTPVQPIDKPRAEPRAEPIAAKPIAKEPNALVQGLAKTRSGWVARLGQLFIGRKELDPALIEEIEKVLLTADIGVRTSQKLLEELRQSLSRKELQDEFAIWNFLRQRTNDLLTFDAPPVDFSSGKPFVLLVIGVNGSGKTTTIGKLAAKLVAEGRSVLLAAGDTFRAAATEQLEVWGGRAGCAVVRGKEGGDPSSVIFEAVKRGKAEGIDIVIADTAGRLHTKTNLMEELTKVRRVLGKAAEGAPHETWLVLDSTSGQNAIQQAQMFTAAMAVSGIVLTKLDGTAKGGVILGIADQLKIPVRFVGVGERVEDLREFDPGEFVEALYQGGGAAAAAS